MEIQRLSVFHIAACIPALVPMCVCGRVSFPRICLEMQLAGWGGGGGPRFSADSLQRGCTELSPGGSPGGSSGSCLTWQPSLMASHSSAGFPSHLGLRNARGVSGHSWFLLCKLPVCLLVSAFYLIDLLTFHSFVLDIDYMITDAFSVCILGFHVYNILFC